LHLMTMSNFLFDWYMHRTKNGEDWSKIGWMVVELSVQAQKFVRRSFGLGINGHTLQHHR